MEPARKRGKQHTEKKRWIELEKERSRNREIKRERRKEKERETETVNPSTIREASSAP